jgi:hypothetical protein
MKKGDLFFGIVLIAIIAFLTNPPTRELYEKATSAYPYLSGFFKFFILATMGELVACRITFGEWKKPNGLPVRSLIWGFVGFMNVPLFRIFSNGVHAVQTAGIIPGDNNYALLTAFYTSVAVNITLGPAIMFFHRISDSYIDLFCTHNEWPSVGEVSNHINWENYISFVMFKTVPLVWIPAHTITFSLPPQHRVLVAAFLSMILGGILAFAAKK